MGGPLPRGKALFHLPLRFLLCLAFLAASLTHNVSAQSPGGIHRPIRRYAGSIAAQFGITVEELAAANNLADVDVLDVGQTLRLPQKVASQVVIVARPGDTIQTIAAREGLSVARLAMLNRIASTARLYPGQLVRLTRDTQRPTAALRFGSVQFVSVPSAIVQGQAGLVAG